MRAVRIHTSGGPEALRIDDLPLPAPGPGQARVKVDVAGVNFIDIYKRTGLYPLPLPATLGEEGAGTVDAVGPDVHDVKPGDRVAWASVTGSYAEYLLAPAARLVPLPSGIDAARGAAVMLQGMTAHYLATATFPLRAGQRCLVHAAAGGVGLLLVQLAKQQGAFVVGTAGSAEKARLARDAGADAVIVYTAEDFVAGTLRASGGEKLDVVYDSVGQSTFLRGLELLRPRGMMVLYGQSSGPVPPFDPQVLNQRGSLFLTRPNLAHYTLTRDELLARASAVLGAVAQGSLQVRIGGEYPLAEVAEAQRALEGRRTTGKVLLRVA